MIFMFKLIKCFILIISGIIGHSSALPDIILDNMLDPICQAKCLRVFKDSTVNSNSASGTLKNPYLLRSYCLKQSECKGCMKACNSSTLPLESCWKYCKTLSKKSQDSCILSCDFINEKKIIRPGICPEDIQRYNCDKQCQKDSDCFKQGTKCCKNEQCNYTCQKAVYPKEGVPPVPPAPIVRQIINETNHEQIQFDLDWSSYNISSIDYPILFVVQIKIGHLNENSKTVFDKWRTLVSTSKSGAIISAIELDTWYQFRLLAFSENGFKNVGEMTLPITVHYNPTNPVAPKNISEKVTRIINGKISVTLVWQPGDSNSLLPLSSYKISWQRIYELNENNPLVTEYDISIPASETHYVIENLLPSATYLVNIVSVVVYKEKRYISSPTAYYVSTASIPQQKKLPEKLDNVDETITCSCGYSNMLLPVEIENSTMINGQLAMKVRLKDGVEFDNNFAPYSFRIRWRPMACIELHPDNTGYPIFDRWQTIVAKNYIDNYVTDLQFHCNYQIEIELFSLLAKKIMKIWEGCFCTPSCNAHFSSMGKVQTPCNYPDQHSIPSINNIRVIVKRSTNKSCTDAEIYWNTKPRTPVTAYRITWGPRLEEPIDETIYSKDFMPLLDTDKAFSRVVNYPVHKSILKDLDLGKIYIVKLQAIDDQSTSRESSLFFKVHSDKNSTYKDRFLNYFLLLLSTFISWYHI